MGCEANPRIETHAEWTDEWEESHACLFDGARLDTGSIVDWLHWRVWMRVEEYLANNG